MKLIVGLGNPGKQYEKTRHNLGFMVIDYYANKKELKFKSSMQGMYAELVVNGEKIILLKPQNYMNLSGDIVKRYFDYYNIKLDDLLIIYDDVDFEIGTFKIKRNGSSGGHNGIKDIINKLGTEYVSRIRIGVSKNNSELADYVLKKLPKADLETVSNLLPKISEAIDMFITEGLDPSMEKYNKRS
jgi:PTH1 family peptidyl-tRNA hydrolase